MTGLILLRPLWLFALLPIAALAVYTRYRRGRGEWSAVIDPALQPVLFRLGLLAPGGHGLQAMLPFGAAALTALALSGPATPRPGAVAFQALDPLVLVLDLSPSVVADAEGLADLKAAAAGLLQSARGRPVGLMLYGGEAYLASAPTTDADSLLSLIGVLDREILPVAGSRPDIALSMARDLFAHSDVSDLAGADLVVVSDGGGSGLRTSEEAARLRNDGARVWAVTLPAARGAPPADPTGMQALAEAGGGAAYPVSEIDVLAGRIDRSRTARLARTDTAGRGFDDLGLWLLPLGMLALFPLFRRQA